MRNSNFFMRSGRMKDSDMEKLGFLVDEYYTHLKIVFGLNPKTNLPEYNCNQDLVF